MPVAVWAAVISALVAFLTLVFGVIRHIVKYSYDKGVTDQRLDSIEKAQAANTDIHAVVAALTSTVAALKESIGRLDNAFERVAGRSFERMVK